MVNIRLLLVRLFHRVERDVREFSNDLIEKRVASPRQAAEVLGQNIENVVLVFTGLAGGVRREEAVLERPQRRNRAKRLLRHNVDAGASNGSAAQGVDQRLLIDAAATGDVDQVRRGPQRRQCVGVDDIAGRWREGAGEHGEISAGQQL